jgi:hypothetical protein
MIDAVAPAARGAPFKTDQLRNQAGAVQKLHAATVQKRQKACVNGRFWIGALVAGDALGSEAFLDPARAPAIGHDFAQAIPAQIIGKVPRCVFWRHRRADFAEQIEDDCLTFAVRDSQGVTVRVPARWIAETAIGDAASRGRS